MVFANRFRQGWKVADWLPAAHTRGLAVVGSEKFPGVAGRQRQDHPADERVRCMRVSGRSHLNAVPQAERRERGDHQAIRN